ncbi:hypothetical protein M446_1212 [Methylobacterium sp. 4-46]|uniref:hypothetical protein n=1 Tax=unclassified Methylobacterium TaxID=2615210 RepID=UPI000152C65A|nr:MULTISPECIES: hypothetical protein [Methylobacterium]ACA15737.1 hypothetical protein M446_1212 [Methylobacterium sp. 4-46]WFT81470.1 hypothetical protein QA634_06165 [Methylobacterium nodulans]
MDADYSSANSNEPSPELERVFRELLAAEGLRLSERNRRFLSFVVAEALAGRGGRVKAYTIGVDVFGRGPDFDPGKDPIVRIEATRIRSALAAYYDGPGTHDPVRLVLRPGSYIPVCEAARLPPAPSAATSACHPLPHATEEDLATHGRMALVVTHRSDRRDRCAMAKGDIFLQAIVRALAGRRFRVFVKPPPEHRAAAHAIRKLLSQPEAVLALDVSVHGIAEGCRYSWSVSDPRSGEVKASGAVDGMEDAVPEGARIDALADAVAQSVTDVVA